MITESPICFSLETRNITSLFKNSQNNYIFFKSKDDWQTLNEKRLKEDEIIYL